MEDRDLDAANALMADDAEIIFPGGKRFTSQAEMVAASKGRYQWVKKHFDRVEAFASADDTLTVYVMGTLYGVNKHGVEFDSIRFIDRFTLRDGLITSQQVWNDLAESNVLTQTH